MFTLYKRLLNATFRENQRRYLIETLTPLFPESDAHILDIGSANGEFAVMLQNAMPHLRFSGLEILRRGEPLIPMIYYDGGRIPFDDGYFDYAMLINMLHHTRNPRALLSEAMRVSKHGVIVKDHYADNLLDYAVLTGMEYLNPNSRALMQLPLKFFTRATWKEMVKELGLNQNQYNERFISYGRHWDWIFGRGMHFVGSYLRCAQ